MPGPEAKVLDRASTPMPEATARLGVDPTATNPDQGPTPLQQLFTDIAPLPIRTLAPHYRTARRAGLTPEVSRIVVSTAAAGIVQSEDVIVSVGQGFDRQTFHPAIRSRVATVGTIGDLRERTTIHAETSGPTVRAEVATRGTLFIVGEHLNALNGHGPKGEARALIEATAARLTTEIVQIEAPTEIPLDVSDDPELEAAQLAATIGVTMDLGNPYRRGGNETTDYSAGIREIGSERVARETKNLLGLPDAKYIVPVAKETTA